MLSDYLQTLSTCCGSQFVILYTSNTHPGNNICDWVDTWSEGNDTVKIMLKLVLP